MLSGDKLAEALEDVADSVLVGILVVGGDAGVDLLVVGVEGRAAGIRAGGGSGTVVEDLLGSVDEVVHVGAVAKVEGQQIFGPGVASGGDGLVPLVDENGEVNPRSGDLGGAILGVGKEIADGLAAVGGGVTDGVEISGIAAGKTLSKARELVGNSVGIRITRLGKSGGNECRQTENNQQSTHCFFFFFFFYDF